MGETVKNTDRNLEVLDRATVLNTSSDSGIQLKHHKLPEILRLELTNTCNLACPHCRHHSADKRQSDSYSPYYRTPIHMTEEQIEGIFDEIAPYKPSVTLNMANEPLIAETFPFAVRKVKECGLSGTFNSNGLTLDRELSQLLVDIQFDSINISIDAVTPGTLKLARGITRLDTLIANIELLLEIRGNQPLPRVGVTFVETDYNYHEIPKFLDFWKERVDVIRLTGYIKDLTPDVSEVPGWSREDLPDRVPCKQIFRDLCIRANGDVTTCVITAESPDLPESIVGNVFRDGGLEAVWNGEKMNRLRTLHNSQKWDDISFCKTCDYWLETFDITEEDKDGFLIRKPSPYTTFYNVKSKMGNWDRDTLIERQSMGRMDT